MQKLAIFGGTFNPIHWGHLLIAETALSQMQLDQVFWVPTFQPSHKSKSSLLLSYEQRCHLVDLAIAAHPHFKAVDIRIHSANPSFAIDTFKAMQELYPDALWHWVVGLDTFQTLPRWYARRELAPCCCWLVAPRPQRLSRSASTSSDLELLDAKAPLNAPLNATSTAVGALTGKDLISNSIRELDQSCINSCIQVVEQLAAQSIDIRWQTLQMPMVGISSSLVRAYCQQQRSIRYLVPESVYAFIAAHHLYES